VVLSLLYYQLLLPLALIKVRADSESVPIGAAATPDNTNGNKSSDTKKDSNNNDNQDKTVTHQETTNNNQNQATGEEKNKEDNANDNKELSEIVQEDSAAKTCDLKNSELTDRCQTELECSDIDKCLVDHSCAEIKKCLSIKIESNNNANINNNVASEANSGNNEIIQNNNDNAIEQNAETDGSDNGLEPTGDNGSSNSNANNNSAASLGLPASPASGQLEPTAEDNGNTNANDNSSTGQSAAIDTGNAAAITDVYNQVNTNIVSDNFQQTTINIDGTYDGDINLLDQFQQVNEANNNSDNELTGSLVIQNENTTELTNNIEVMADSGDNAISATGSDPLNYSSAEQAGNVANIQTGDAVAVSSTVNVVNTNIVGNNVLFAVVNVYGEWNGDLIVPGEGLLEVAPEPVYAVTEIVNENNADVNNNVVTEADTGNNGIIQEGSSNSAQINSGEAYAESDVLNIVNTNIVKNNFFFLMINNLGSWTGKILNWNEENNSYSNIFSYDFGVLADGVSPTIDGLLAVFNKNSAQVDNKVSVSANTGGNIIETEGDGAQATIRTGNAVAMAKIINFINTNIVGNNWLFAIVNVMGKWNGNAVFAYPDLAISISDGRDQVGPGESIDYKVTYKNNGKAACNSVKILVALPDYVSSAGQGLDYTLSGLKPGEEKSFSVLATVSSDIPEGSTDLNSAAGITTGTKEIALGNNSASDTTIAYRAPLESADSESANLEPANVDSGDTGITKVEDTGVVKNNPGLTLTREVKDKELRAGNTVVYSIFIENTGDVNLHNVVVFDQMKNKSGVAGSFSWKLGDVDAGRKLRIQYKLAISPQALPGTYLSVASAYGYDKDDNKITAQEASQKITVKGIENNLVNNYQPGNNISTSIVQYYTQYITGGICYLDHWPAEDLINQADAANLDSEFLGTEDSSSGNPIPFWMWLAAALSYFLSINWSLFPKREVAEAMVGVAGLLGDTLPAEVETEAVTEEDIGDNPLAIETDEKNS